MNLIEQGLTHYHLCYKHSELDKIHLFSASFDYIFVINVINLSCFYPNTFDSLLPKSPIFRLETVNIMFNAIRTEIELLNQLHHGYQRLQNPSQNR